MTQQYLYASLGLNMAYQEQEQQVILHSPDIQTGSTTKRKEQEPLQGEIIFIVGGASGTGRLLTTEAHRLGARVIASSTSPEKLDTLTTELGEGLHTFVADLTKPEQFYEGLTQLIKHDGIVPTAIVHSAAGGMEGFSQKLVNDLRRLRTIRRTKNPQEFEEALEKIRKETETQVLNPENIAAAIQVNFYGHAITLSLLKELLPTNAKAKDIYWSSTWSDLGKIHSAFKDQNDTSQEIGIDVPIFYSGVAGSKGRFLRWQKQHASDLVNSGIYPAVVSGHIINGSDAGRMIDTFIFSTLLPKEQHEEMKKYYITQQDMVNATIDLIQSDPTTWPEYPHRVFVVGGRPVSKDLLPNDQMFKVKIPL